jgi:amino-acid N-acetyltransferase
MNLRSIAPYLKRHRGQIFVVALGGDVLLSPHCAALIEDLALLRTLGIHIVLVHGSRPQIDHALQQAGLPVRTHAGLRLTDAATLPAVLQAVGSARVQLEAAFARHDCPTVCGNWLWAQPVGVLDGIDYGHTGHVRKVDQQRLHGVLAAHLPILSPLGVSPSGECFNLRFEEVATHTAIALQADKLLFISDSNPDGWPFAEDTGDVGQVSVSEAERALPAFNDDDRRMVQSGLQALAGGVARVHWVWDQPEALLQELFTPNGSGLMLCKDEGYDSIRPATLADMGGVLALIQPLESAGLLVPRSKERLELELPHFRLMVRDGLVIACAALLPFGVQAEIACVAVHPDYRGAGRASLLLENLEQQARKQGVQQLFTLTTQTNHWFVERGFVQSVPEVLPQERGYNEVRRAKVLVKGLG